MGMTGLDGGNNWILNFKVLGFTIMGAFGFDSVDL